MSNPAETLTELINLSRELGREQLQLAILGEGNTSADIGDGTFWIKASGSQLGLIDEAGFCRVRCERVLELLSAERLSDAEIRDGLQSVVEGENRRQPSVETFLHALFLTEGEARWVAHTHPIAVNQILCSQLGAEPFLGHIYPDAIVVCGRAPAVIPYVDPGLPLAQAARATLRSFREEHGHPPKTVLMVNHGLVALGQTSQEALNITLMADKWARVLAGTYALGGPRYLPDEQVARIDGRLDEAYRRGQLSGSA